MRKFEKIKQILCGLTGHKYTGKNFKWSEDAVRRVFHIEIQCERCDRPLYLKVPFSFTGKRG